MQILFVTSEVAPYSQTSEVSRVCSSLPKALQGVGHSLTVLSPLYKGIDPAVFSLARRLSGVKVPLGERVYECELYDGRTAGGVNLLFVGSREYFSPLSPPVLEESEKSALAASLLSRTAVELARSSTNSFQILHAHDWPAALTMFWAKALVPEFPRLLSLHNARKQGTFDRDIVSQIGLDPELADKASAEGHLNFLQIGIQNAQYVIGSSQAACVELTQEGRVENIEDALCALGDKLVGIPNGIDASIWNPLTDVYLKSRFNPNDLAGKQRCKAAFQHEMNLPIRGDVPLFSALAPLDHDHGADLLAEAAEQALQNDIQLVVIGNGDHSQQIDLFSEISLHFPDRFKVQSSDDQSLYHRAISASDFTLVPCRVAECGLLTMSAQRYGALPVARRVGSIQDTVVDCDNSLKSGNGFLFESDSAEELLASIQRATAAFTKRDRFEDLRRRTMRIDNSWDRSARRYDLLYRNLAEGNEQ
jgi:starch synthase